MEKIILAIDAINPDTSALEFACYVARLTKSKLTGIFLENLVADERPILTKAYGSAYVDWRIDETDPEYQYKAQLIEKNISLFKQACESRSVNCVIHRDRNVPAREIISESRYADLVIVDAATSFNKRFEGTPTEFVKDILKDAECPVVIAPESFDGVDEIVFTYKNSPSCVFAMKQFTYLFPELKDRKTTILQINDKGVWADQDKYNFKEWLQNHYPKLTFEVQQGDADDKLLDFLFKRKNVFIVMGAYGRSSLSRFFNRSHADRIISTVTQPIFISHH